MVVDAIAFAMSLISDHDGGRLTEANVDLYLNFIVSLAENSAPSNPQRFISFAALFSKLKPSMQCKIVLDMESLKESRWKSLPSFTVLFESLCAAFSSCQVFEEPVSTNKIAKVLQLFVRMGNRDWLVTFIESLTKFSKSFSSDKRTN